MNTIYSFYFKNSSVDFNKYDLYTIDGKNQISLNKSNSQYKLFKY